MATDGGSADGTAILPAEGGPAPHDGGGGNGDGGSVNGDAGGIAYVDAGYYYGDGSFWVEGGAYPDAGGESDAALGGDSGSIDASPGCTALAACCGSLSGSTQSLCNTIVGLGNASNCATELSQLQNAGECTGVSILASQVQVAPNRVVSDGRLLFWTTASTPGLLAMPVGGGAVTVLLDGPLMNTNGSSVWSPDDTFLAVDDVNVYVLMNNALVRIPKTGGSTTLVSVGAFVVDATALGTTAYWVASPSGNGPNAVYPLQSAPLLGGPALTIASFKYPGSFSTDEVAVTSSTAFVGSEGPYGTELYDFSVGTPASTTSLSDSCIFVTSDQNAIYCAQKSGSNVAIASDGTTIALGPAVNSSYIVFDDTYAYWADMTTVGTIMKAPKAGGGPATVIARDTSPTAIAVDANSVYWSDQEGYIKSVPK